MRQVAMLRAIQAFEAAARYGSYVDAAAELKVTPAAIGQQVRALEAWLGVSLFNRLGSGALRLVPTDAARAALPEFKEGLDKLDAGLRRLKQRRDRRTLTVSVSQSFAARWLLPRLEGFTARHPKVDLQLSINDRLVDIAHGEADLGIRCGRGGWRGLDQRKIMDEQMVVVCSPSLLQGRNRFKDLKALTEMPLLHDTSMTETSAFPSWEAWLSHWQPGLRAPPGGLRINSSAGVIQAAIAGQGVALVRHCFVRREIETGQLRQLFKERNWPIAWAYYTVRAPATRDDPAIDAFIDWIGDTARQDIIAS
jgi:LysR family transcriptional regulator, glycine cleavage system transcriptional activator